MPLLDVVYEKLRQLLPHDYDEHDVEYLIGKSNYLSHSQYHKFGKLINELEKWLDVVVGKNHGYQVQLLDQAESRLINDLTMSN